MKKLLICLIVIGLFPFKEASAAKLCYSNKTASIVTRTKCKKSETLLSGSNLGSLIGATGPAGANGSQGPQGTQGVKGDLGDSAFDPIPSGQTVHGVIGMGNSTSAAFLWTTSALPAEAPQGLSADDIVIVQTPALITACPTITDCLSTTELAKDSSGCTGTADSPTAPAGKICIYPRVWIQLENALALPVGASGESSKYGFGIQWESPSGSTLGASWAYKAP